MNPNVDYSPEALAARTRLEIWQEIMRHGGVDAETASKQAKDVWAALGFPSGQLDCWAVVKGDLIIQNYATESIAREHAEREQGLRAIRIREVK